MRRDKDLKRSDHRKEAHLQYQQNSRGRGTYLVDVNDLAVEYLSFERLHNDGGVGAFEPRLAGRWKDLAFTDRSDTDDRDDVPEVSVA